MDVEFKFRGKDYKLEELLGEGDLFELVDNSGNPVGKIITRAGIGNLTDKLGNIEFELGPIQAFKFDGKDNIGVEVACRDLTDPKARIGRAFGEASSDNCYGIAGQYPAAMAEKRGKARAFLDLMGMRGVYSEDEAKELKDQVNEQKSRTNGKRKHKETSKLLSGEEAVKRINKLMDSKGLDDDIKINAYRDVLGDTTLSPAQIRARADDEVKNRVMIVLEEAYGDSSSS